MREPTSSSRAGTESKCSAAALWQADGGAHEPLPPFGYSQSCSRAYRAASWRVRVWVFCIALDR
ncbi:hypothetical protein EDD35_6615 [Amycolatopsis thermoflava]|uniref:Uncharacterized protein n=1 Tax=Amycolatopsis thermoflava TaxID=84480 RepID=A0A3N2H5I5_9PSEU|nr:hypothetical protein EDD35_6615 [Amycolatopsis thermoflava]